MSDKPFRIRIKKPKLKIDFNPVNFAETSRRQRIYFEEKIKPERDAFWVRVLQDMIHSWDG